MVDSVGETGISELYWLVLIFPLPETLPLNIPLGSLLLILEVSN